MADRSNMDVAVEGLPWVSCIMPTANRRRFVARSLACFFEQDYPNCELVVVDEGADRVEDLMPSNARIRYVALDRRMSIGVGK
jgi:hypothetical protein